MNSSILVKWVKIENNRKMLNMRYCNVEKKLINWFHLAGAIEILTIKKISGATRKHQLLNSVAGSIRFGLFHFKSTAIKMNKFI